MKHKIPMADGDEQDALCHKSRRIIVSFGRPGIAKKAKRRYNKRERKILNNETMEEI